LAYWPVKPPTCEDLDVIAHTIARRISGFLEKAGYLVRDAESEYLDLMQGEEDAMGAIVGTSTDASDRTYRLAFGPNAGLGAPDETADVTDSLSENRAAQRRR
jgi:hypothetical protein